MSVTQNLMVNKSYKNKIFNQNKTFFLLLGNKMESFDALYGWQGGSFTSCTSDPCINSNHYRDVVASNIFSICQSSSAPSFQ